MWYLVSCLTAVLESVNFLWSPLCYSYTNLSQESDFQAELQVHNLALLINLSLGQVLPIQSGKWWSKWRKVKEIPLK